MSEDDTTLQELLGSAGDLVDGAAMQSAEERAGLEGLPRVLRYAILGASERSGTRRQLAAEIVEIAPELGDEVRAWMKEARLERTLALAKRLDQLSVELEAPVLRSLADSVRVVALPVPKAGRPGIPDYMRVVQASQYARAACEQMPPETLARIDRALLGWAVAPLLAQPELRQERLSAIVVGTELLDEMLASLKAAEQKSPAGVNSAEKGSPDLPAPVDGECPPDHVIVCRRAIVGPVTARSNESIRPYVPVLNVPIPLVRCPDLRGVRKALVSEFPYAQAAVDFVLAGLVGRTWVEFEPILLIGQPGCGKTRLAGRLAELLGVGLWRIDGTQADGSAIGGTDKRWSTASPCGPFAAIARYGHANPVVLVDEAEKAATRADYGNLWNSLVALCERENAKRYPDPCLGAEVDISHVSFVATANSIIGLPGPLLDPFRQVVFPPPRAQDLDVLAESMRFETACERQVDARFIAPLDGMERALIQQKWGGGSIRHLRRLLDVIWRAREKNVRWQ